MHVNGTRPHGRVRALHGADGPHGNGTGSSAEAIEIAIPARPDMMRIVRMSAGVIAARADLPYEDLDDLCLAIDELGVLVMGATPGASTHSDDDTREGARLWVRFSWHAGDVTVHCVLTPDNGPGAPMGGEVGEYGAQAHVDRSWSTPGDSEPLAHLILDALVDDYGLSEHDGNPAGWLHKRRVEATG